VGTIRGGLHVRSLPGGCGECLPIARASLRATPQPAATPEAATGPAFLAVVDALGTLSPRAQMARLGARAFFPRFSRRFVAERLHAQRRRRRSMRPGCRGRLLLGNPLGQGEQGKDHCLPPPLVVGQR